MDQAVAELAERLAAEYDEALRRVRAENADLAERLIRLGASVYCDPEEDEFILMVGMPGPAATLEVDDVFNLRIDPETWKILGFDVPDVKACALVHPSFVASIRRLIQLALRAPGTYARVEGNQVAEIASSLRQLVAA